MNTFSRIAS